MDRLYKGIHKFQQTHYKQESEFFKRIGKGQAPDVLFFTCSDSRVDPNLFTQSKPGELFIVKNVGNIVPPNEPMRKKTCTAAAIEFAIVQLKVTDVVVCGHSDCGALKALWLEEKDFEEMPNLKDWVDTAAEVKEAVMKHSHDPSYKALIEKTEKEYIVRQLENLKTYPLIREAVEEGKLNIHGWYYDIETGVVFAYNPRTHHFDRIEYSDNGLNAACLEKECEDIH